MTEVIVMGLTSRDLEVVRLLEKNMVLTAEQLAVLVFSTGNERAALTIAQRRLRTLYTKKQIKRYRNHTTSSYYYYLGDDCNLSKHKKLFGDVLVALKKNGYEIVDVCVEYRGFYEEGFQIRPDMRIELLKDGVGFSLFVEVQLLLLPTPFQYSFYTYSYSPAFVNNHFLKFPYYVWPLYELTHI